MTCIRDKNLAVIDGATSDEASRRERSLVRAVLVAGAIFLILGNGSLLLLMVGMMPRNDFGRTLWSASAFLEGADMYAPSFVVHHQLDGHNAIDLWNLNPPHFHVFLLPLAILPQSAALLAWCVLGGLCLDLSLRLIGREIGRELTLRERRWTWLGLLASSAMGAALATAHMSFPLMLLVTLAWRDARHGRWTRAGAGMGLGMSLKPFLLVFVPYLVLSRRWRGAAAAGLAVGLSFLLGLAIFGVDNHRSWLQRLGTAHSWAWLPMNASLYGILSRALTDNPMLASLAALLENDIRTIWLCLGVPAGLLALAVSLADTSQAGVDRAFGILLVSALLLSPLGWTYYFWLSLGPVALSAAGWWHSRRGAIGEAQEGRSVWCRRLMLGAAPGLFYPILATTWGQPLPLATLFFGSIFFWSLLLVWLALILDGFPKRHPRGGTVAPAETFGAERRVARPGPGSIAS
jgi:hypothetical protein